MENNDEIRKRELKKVLLLEKGFKNSMRELNRFPFDAPSPLVTLDLASILNAIKISLQNSNYEQVVEWANFFEMRDDIEIADSPNDAIKTALFEFANPEISGETLPDLLKIWEKKLQQLHES